MTETCALCGGRGWVGQRDKCPVCKGTGVIPPPVGTGVLQAQAPEAPDADAQEICTSQDAGYPCPYCGARIASPPWVTADWIKRGWRELRCMRCGRRKLRHRTEDDGDCPGCRGTSFERLRGEERQT